VCGGSKKARFCTGKWTYSAPCPDCCATEFAAAEIDGDHFVIEPAKRLSSTSRPMEIEAE
jgi:hypothetical protein